MTQNSGGRPAADGQDDQTATFDQTGGLMSEYEGEEDTGGDSAAAPGEIGNPLRPGGQDGAVGDVDDGEEPHLDPDEQNP